MWTCTLPRPRRRWWCRVLWINTCKTVNCRLFDYPIISIEITVLSNYGLWFLNYENYLRITDQPQVFGTSRNVIDGLIRISITAVPQLLLCLVRELRPDKFLMDNKLIFYYLLIISIIYMFIMCLNVCPLPVLSSRYGHGCTHRESTLTTSNATVRVWKRKMDGWLDPSPS